MINTNAKETGSYDMDSFIEKSMHIKENSNQIFQILKIKNKKKWTKEEDLLLIKLAEKHKEKHWKEISRNFQNKNALQCFSRYKRIRPGIIKGSWKKEEDEKILKLVEIYGKSWSKISKILVTRNGKQIRDRFINVLDPDIKKGKFTEEEDKLLIRLYLYYGPKWATISKHYNNRTADMIKNRFHSSIKKLFFMDNGVTVKKNMNINANLGNLNFPSNNLGENNSNDSSNFPLDENLATNLENLNMQVDEDYITGREENFSKLNSIKHNNHKSVNHVNDSQNNSRHFTNTQTISLSLENLGVNKERFIDEEMCHKFRGEEKLTPEEFEKIKELKEIIEYKDYHLAINENDVYNTKNNSNVNDNLYLNDDNNLINFNDDGNFSPEENYGNLFHFEDYFSF